MHHRHHVACFVFFIASLSFLDLHGQEGARRAPEEFGAHVLGSLNDEGKDPLLEPSNAKDGALCTFCHVSWLQSYQVGTIVIYILH